MRGLPCVAVRWLACVLVLPGCAEPAPVGQAGLPITRGDKESGYPAVFSLAYDGVGGCTGTCIAPRIGVTAAHCLWDTEGTTLTAVFGRDELDPDAVVAVSATAIDPGGGDIAMLAFADSCPAVGTANRAALEGHVAEPVVVVGYGVTSETGEDFGIKRSGVATLFSVDPAEVNGLEPGELATGNDPAGTCYGDSGGPTFMTLDGVEVVVGVTSRGSNDDEGNELPCDAGQSIAVRLDSHAPFLDDFMATHDTGELADPDDGAVGPAPGDEPTMDEPGLPDDGDVLGETPLARNEAGASGSGCGIGGRGAPHTPHVALVALAALGLGLGRRHRRR